MSFRENAKIIKTGCLGTGVYEIWFETSDIAKAANRDSLYQYTVLTVQGFFHVQSVYVQ